MDNLSREAREYLFPRSAWFWQWVDRGEVIAWRGGPTIAFRDELAAVLEPFRSEGLPPLSSVVLLLAACRNSWGESSFATGTLAGFISTITRSDLPPWAAELLGHLDEVYDALPESLRTDTRAKSVLVQVVFEEAARRTSVSDAEEIVQVLRDGPEEGFAERSRLGPEESATIDVGELRCLLDGLERLDLESLELRIRTGLDALVEPAEIEIEELDDAGRARRLLRELTEDTELAGLARLAGRMVAAVTLPRPMDRHDDLALGGVSDISNRGPLDKLLLSELAHDDLTLSVRIAVGEALYLRQESPPHHPARERLLVVDSGIRLWGIPRVFATAAALALSATSDRHAPVRAFRAARDRLKPIDLLTREGLIAHMEALETEAHPGAALTTARALSAESGDTADLIVITSDDAAADPEFQRDVAAAGLPPWYLATVGRDGAFQLCGRNEWGGRRIMEARFNLESLLAPRPKPGPELVDESKADLPAVFSLEEFPLLMPHHPVELEKAWVVGDRGVLTISNDRRLMWWQTGRRAARQIAEGMPRGVVLWSSPFVLEGHASAVVGNARNMDIHLLEIDLDGNACEVIPLETRHEPVRGVTAGGEVVFLIYRDRFDVVSTGDGQRLATSQIPGKLTHVRDRFFRGHSGDWFISRYDGQSAGFERIPFDFDGSRHNPIGFFDWAGCPGPVGITDEGNLLLTHEERVVRIAHSFCSLLHVAVVSSDGGRLVVIDEEPKRSAHPVLHVVDVAAATARRLPYLTGISKDLAEPSIRELARPRMLRHRLAAAAVVEGRFLGLISHKGYIVCFHSKGKYLLLNPARNINVSAKRFVQRFKPLKHAGIVRYTLGVATWPDGSRAFLDSRGLLHLKSSDPSIPEATIVLHEGVTSGWCSDGRVWGEAYFLDDPPIAEATEIVDGDRIYHDVLEPFTKWIQ